MNDFQDNKTFFGQSVKNAKGIAIDAVADTTTSKAYVVTGETFDALPLKMHAAHFQGQAAPSVRVAFDDNELERFAASADGSVEAIELPSSPAARAKLIADWAKKAAKKNKKGIMPLLLLPLAACGGGGGGDDGPISVAELIDLDAVTDGIIVETIAEGDLATLVMLTNRQGNNQLTITVSDDTADAGDLNTVDGATTLVVDATQVEDIEGTAADVITAIQSTGIETSTDYNVTISDGTSVAQALILEADTSGVITATITEDDLATLVSLVDGNSNNALTITIADAGADASDLNTVDDATTVDVDAEAVTSVSGSLADLAALFGSDGILLAADITVTFDSVADASAQDVADLNVVIEGTSGVVTGTIAGDADVLAGILADGDSNAENALTITVSDAASVAEGAQITAATSALTVDFSAGISDSLGNLASGGAAAADLSEIVAKAADVAIAIDPAITDASAQDIADINAVLAETTGDVSVDIDGDAATLAGLAPTASDDGSSDFTITVNDAATAAEGAAIADATDAATVDFSAAGVVDTLENLATGGVTEDLDKIAAKDADVAVVITDATLTGADITDLNAVANATDGVVTATLVDDLLNLAALDTAPTDAIDITVTSTTNDAAGLLTLDGKTSIVVEALAMEAIEGSAANIIAAVEAPGINVDGDFTVDVTDGQATVAQFNTIDAFTTGVITATISNGDLASLRTLTNLDGQNLLTITVTDATALAADLTTVNGVTLIEVDATAVTDLTGAMDDVLSLFFAGGVDLSDSLDVFITDVTVDAAEVNSLDDATTGTVTITNSTEITGTAAEVLEVIGSAGVTTEDDYAVTLEASPAAAADLLAIDADTTGQIDATEVTELTGSVADINAVLGAAGITMDAGLVGDFDITIDDGSASVAELIALDPQTSGVITATVSDTSIAALLNLPDAFGNNALTFTLADTTAAALDLIALAGKTTVALDASAVTTITGTAADITTALDDALIGGLSVTTAQLDAGSYDAASITALAARGDVTGVDAGDTTTLTGDVPALTAVLQNGDVSGLGDVPITIDGSGISLDAADLAALNALTTGLIDASAVGTLTGSAAAVQALLDVPLEISGLAALNVVLDTTSEDAVALTGLLATGLVADIDASNLTDLTGTVSEVSAVLSPAGGTISGPSGVAVTLDSIEEDASALSALAGATEIDSIDATAISELNGTVSEITTALDDPAIAPLSITTADLDAGTVDAASITALVNRGDVAGVDASAVTLLTGDVTALIAVLQNGDVDGLDAVNVQIDGTDISVDAAALATLNGLTTGTIDGSAVGTVTGDASEISAFLDVTTITNLSNLTAQLDAGPEAATDITDLDAAGNVDAVDASAVTLLTGSVEDINTLYGNLSVTGLDDVDVEISGDDVEVVSSDLQTLDDNTTGTVDADAIDTISGSASALATIYSSAGISELGDDDQITVTGTSAAAADLNTIAGALLDAGLTDINVASLTDVSGSAADLAALYTNGDDFTGLGDEAVLVTSATSAAADVNAIDDANSGVVNTEDNVTTFTGSVSDIQTLQSAIGAGDVTANSGYNVTITDLAVDAAEITALIGIGSGRTTGQISLIAATDINGTEAELIAFYTQVGLNVIQTSQDYDLLVEAVGGPGGTIEAANIVQFDAFTTGTITTDAGTITGSLEDLATVFSSLEVDMPADINVIFDADASVSVGDVTDLNLVLAATTGTVSGTLTGETSVLAGITDDLSGLAVANLTVVLTDGEANATDILAIADAIGTGSIDGSALTAINGSSGDVVAALDAMATDPALFNTDLGATAAEASEILEIAAANDTGVINGSLITALNGSYADIAAAKVELGTNISANYTITADSPMTVVEYNDLDVDTTGIITATISDGAMADLLTITDDNSNSALTITVTDASVIATELTTLDGKTTVEIDARGVTNLSGTVEQINAVLDAAGITNPTTMTATINAGTEDATDLSDLLALTNVTLVNASAVTQLNGTATEVLEVLDAGGITNPSSATVLISEGEEVATDLTDILGTTGITSVDATAVTSLEGTVDEINAVLTDADITNPTTMTATISAGTEAATDLTALLAEGNVTSVDASAVTTLTGTATQVLAVLGEDGITDPSSATVSLAGDTEAASDLTALIDDPGITGVNATAVLNLTGTVAEINAVLDEVAIIKAVIIVGVISAGTEAASDLTALETELFFVDATAVTSLEGTVAEINAVLTEADIANPTAMTATISAGSEAATDLTALLAQGNVTAVDASAVTTLTGTVAQINAVLTEEDITNPTAASATIAASSELATDLTDLLATDSITSIDASAVTNLSGTVEQINAVLSAGDIGDPTSMTATISAGTEAAADLTALLALGNVSAVDASAVTTLIGTATAVLSVLAEGSITDPTAAAVTISAGTEAAADLTAVLTDGSITSVNASAVTTLTGTVADINAVLTEGDITNPTTMTATISAGTEAATDLTALLAEGNVTSVDASAVTTLTGTVAEINAVLTEGDITNPTTMTATISAGTEAATDLTALLAEGNVTSVDAEAVTTLTGSFAEVNAVLSEANIDTDSDFDAVLSGSTTVDDINALNLVTTGVITATVDEDDLATLLTLSTVDGENALTITVATPASVDAADLNQLDSITSLAITATAMTTITGTAAAVATMAASDGIVTSGAYAVTLDAGTAVAADLVTIDGDTTGLIDATLIATITGSAADAVAVVNSSQALTPGITLASDYDVDLEGDADVSQLTAIVTPTTGLVTADDITDTADAINQLANSFSSILQNATGTVTVEGSLNPQTMDMLDAQDFADLVIDGRSGDDIITGSLANDTIIGGLDEDVFFIQDINLLGNDAYHFVTTNADGADVSQGRDILQFSSANLTATTGFTDYAGTGEVLTLVGGAEVGFEIGTAASEAGATFVFNDTTGELIFDADGSGAEAAITVGTFFSDGGTTAIDDILSADLTFVA